MRGKNKRGQVTIFVILAIIILVFGVAIYFFYPEISSTSVINQENPKAYIQDCVEDTLAENVDLISTQGGSLQPEFSYNYLNDDLQYLCYTNEYYTLCTVQQPLLIASMQNELKESLTQKVNECFDSLERDYEEEGYDVDLQRGDFLVEILPEKVLVRINNELTLSKDSTETYSSFDVVADNNLYELASIAMSIVNWETKLGDSETTTYMNYYHDLKVEKKKRTDGTTVYIITDRDTEDKFQFASRSNALPPGVYIPETE